MPRITPARTNDITAARAMPIEPGATYVFDLGYDDYACWKKLDDAGCRIVTRFQRNTPLQAIIACRPSGVLGCDRRSSGCRHRNCPSLSLRVRLRGTRAQLQRRAVAAQPPVRSFCQIAKTLGEFNPLPLGEGALGGAEGG